MNWLLGCYFPFAKIQINFIRFSFWTTFVVLINVNSLTHNKLQNTNGKLLKNYPFVSFLKRKPYTYTSCLR